MTRRTDTYKRRLQRMKTEGRRLDKRIAELQAQRQRLRERVFKFVYIHGGWRR